METYEIYLNGSLVDTDALAGLAYLKYESARRLGAASLVRVSHNPDPVLGGRWAYNYEDGGWDYIGPAPRPKAVDPMNTDPAPICTNDCRYRQKYTGFTLQRNALRIELASMVAPFRCGWNIRAGMIGGDPLDYEPCIFLPEKLKGICR